MNASERLNSLCLESEELNGLLRQSNFFEVVDEGEQKDWELRENALSSNRAEQEQIKELQSQLDTLRKKENEAANEYNSLIERTRQLEKEGLEQEENIKTEQQSHFQLEQEIRELEEQCAILENSEELKEPDTDADRLALALFHGLGIQSKIEGDKVDTVVLTTSNSEDILSLALNANHRPEFTANYVWNFISK